MAVVPSPIRHDRFRIPSQRRAHWSSGKPTDRAVPRTGSPTPPHATDPHQPREPHDRGKTVQSGGYRMVGERLDRASWMLTTTTRSDDSSWV